MLTGSTLSRIVAELKIDLKLVSLSLRQRRNLGSGSTAGCRCEREWLGGMQRSGLAYFAGRSDDTLVALIGSSKHFWGESRLPEISVNSSTTPALVEVLGEEQEPGGSIGRHLSDEDRILYEIRDSTRQQAWAS